MVELVDDAEALRAAIGRLVRVVRSVDGLPANQAVALGHVVRDGPLSIAELARRERVTHQSMSRTVGLLEVAGYVRQDPDRDSRRQLAVVATTQGHRRLSEERHARADALAKAVATVGGNERLRELRRVTAFLTELADAYERSRCAL